MEQQNKISEELVLKLRKAFKVWHEGVLEKIKYSQEHFDENNTPIKETINEKND